MRLYSIASPRRRNRNTSNLALTVKREPQGVCSNFVCDLKKGDKVQVTGPFRATFLMPNDPGSQHRYDLHRDGLGRFAPLPNGAAGPCRTPPAVLLFFARAVLRTSISGLFRRVPDALLGK